MNRSDLGAGVGLVALGGAMAALTFTFPRTGEYIGPAFLPRIVAGGLVLLGLALAWSARRGPSRADLRLPAGTVRRAAVLVGAVVLYLVLLARVTALGFPLLTPPLLFVVGILFGGRPGVPLALASVLTGGLTYALFRLWLGLPLPPSAWF